jgi:NADP-dependent 3-hydroxy acid dehydrogenase YdfG
MLDDKVVVVTGASSGIGAAVAVLLAERGASVVLVARRKDALEAVAARCGDNVLPIVGDMTSRADVRRIVEQAIAHFGHIDVWVNNVGRGITTPPSQLTDDDIDAMMLVNVKSALYGMQEVLPHFKARGEGQVVNISSMLGRLPHAVNRSAYFREEVQQTHPGIEFSLVSPGVVRTDFGYNALHGGPASQQLPNSQGVDEVAPVVVKVIEARCRDVYTRAGARQRVIDYYASIGIDP